MHVPMERVRLREFRGLAPKYLFGGLAPLNHPTMVIILPHPSPPFCVVPPPFIKINKDVFLLKQLFIILSYC